jgi:hypothetical protein
MRRVVPWALAAIAVCACSSAGTTGDGGGASVSGDQAASDAASALCSRYNACSAFFVESEFGDVTSCTSALKAIVADSLSANGTAQTPADVEKCAAKIPSVSCDDAFNHNLPSECQPVAGPSANGAACADASQCQSAFCNKPANATCGACGAAPTTGAQCDKTQHPCKSSLTCKNGACATPDGAGASCTPGAKGDIFGSCDVLAGTYCDPRTSICAKINLVGAGQACLLVNGTVVLCSSKGACNAPQGATMGVCEAAAAPGANCDATNGPNCLRPAKCAGGVCKTPNAASCR